MGLTNFNSGSKSIPPKHYTSDYQFRHYYGKPTVSIVFQRTPYPGLSFLPSYPGHS